jgi:UDP:flavonoid glycosyltransferase YjiC (YdhE family)
VKRYLMTLWDGGGNVPPQLAIARRLVARGHDVQVLADPTIEPEARAAGCGFSPWVTAPHRTTRDRSGDLVRDYEHKNPMTTIRKYLNEFLGDPQPRWIADIMGALERQPADVVITDFGIPSALIVAEKLGLPAAAMVPNIWIIPTPGIPPMGGFMPARGPLGRLRERVVRGLMTAIFNKAVPALNRARADLGLAPVASTFAQMLKAQAVLVLTSPVFDFTSPHMPWGRSSTTRTGPSRGARPGPTATRARWYWWGCRRRSRTRQRR